MILHGREVVVVGVKPTPVHLDKAHTGLDQFTSNQGTPAKVAITITGQGVG